MRPHTPRCEPGAKATIGTQLYLLSTPARQSFPRQIMSAHGPNAKSRPGPEASDAGGRPDIRRIHETDAFDPNRTSNAFLNHAPTRSQLRPLAAWRPAQRRIPAPRPSAAHVAARKPISALSSQWRTIASTRSRRPRTIPKPLNDSPGGGDQIGASNIAAASCLAARSTYGARPLSFPRAGPQSHRLPLTMKDRPPRSRLP